MTAPTPEEWIAGIDFLKRLVISDSHRSERAQALLDGIAAMHHERIEAIENARASQQMHEQARLLLDQTLTERDAVQADNHKIAEMYRIVVKQLADAPHSESCAFKTTGGWLKGDRYRCTFWKSEL